MTDASAMSPWQRWYWLEGGKDIKRRYYAKLTKTAAGRAALAEYKRFRRACIKNGIWSTQPRSRA